MSDLFEGGVPATAEVAKEYTAADIEVLEGLEPVRKRPGMYIGGTDDRAYHHMAAEVIDNAMDEVVAGFANRIEVELNEDGSLTVRDNGRGIPTDPHPKYPDKSALEVILTTLHSGGKFSGKAYQTAGGLHGVGSAVVNALSSFLHVEVARDKKLVGQKFERGNPLTSLEDLGGAPNRRGTTVRFMPDTEIFGESLHFRPARLFRMIRSKAYLFRGVEIRWKCAENHLKEGDETPAEKVFSFPGGLEDFLKDTLKSKTTLVTTPFAGKLKFPEDQGEVEWAVNWAWGDDGFSQSYCNTIPTPQGGTHETGIRGALTKGIRAYGELVGNKKINLVTPDDVTTGMCSMLSVFIREPQFSGQTKEKLSSPHATKLVETAIRDHFDHWLTGNKQIADGLLTFVIEKAEERLKRRQEKEVSRKQATRRLRLPGKLADCSQKDRSGTELFLVEGDSAGGSAKQARRRATQAVLPLRGKILNVASATTEKMKQNQELNDLMLALGVQTGSKYIASDLRYDKVIIMTDADVDGAHIASLLMTYFYQELPQLIGSGHLYLAMPPLYRIVQGAKSIYARDDQHKDELLASEFNGRGKIDISRFKGLGEMPPAQLKETTMDPDSRVLLQVEIAEEDGDYTADMVNQLMGKKPELRFRYIQENAASVTDIDV